MTFLGVLSLTIKLHQAIGPTRLGPIGLGPIHLPYRSGLVGPSFSFLDRLDRTRTGPRLRLNIPGVLLGDLVVKVSPAFFPVTTWTNETVDRVTGFDRDSFDPEWRFRI